MGRSDGGTRLTWHLTLASTGRRPLASDPAQRLRLLRRLSAIAGPDLLLFHLVDDHAHVVLETNRTEAGGYARRIAQAWAHARAARLEPTHFREVEDRAHLLGLVEYVLRQSVRHGLHGHPADAAGSCFWDLVDLRDLPGFHPGALRAALPRLKDARIWSAVGLDGPPPGADPDVLLGGLGLEGLLAAAGDALACDPMGGATEDVWARAVVASVSAGSGLRSEAVARSLGWSERSQRRLRSMEVPQPVRARILNLAALRLAVRALPPPEPTESERRSLDRSRVLAGAGALW